MSSPGAGAHVGMRSPQAGPDRHRCSRRLPACRPRTRSPPALLRLQGSAWLWVLVHRAETLLCLPHETDFPEDPDLPGSLCMGHINKSSHPGGPGTSALRGEHFCCLGVCAPVQHFIFPRSMEDSFLFQETFEHDGPQSLSWNAVQAHGPTSRFQDNSWRRAK